MEINTISLPKLTANADYIFVDALASLPREAYNSGLFKIIPVGMNSGDTRVFTEMDDEEYAEFRGEGDQSARADVQVGYDITVTAEYMAKDIGITERMRSFNKYPEIIRKFTNLGRLVPNKMDLDLTHRLTFGTVTTYTDAAGRTIAIACGDTKALFATDHALAGSTTTYRSIVANNPVLSRGAIEAAELLLVQRYNNLGELKSVTADKLWTSNDPNTVNTAREYLQSTADPDSTHSGVINPYKSKYTHIILPRLATTAAGAYDSTKAKYWGLASSDRSTAYIGIWQEPYMVAPTVGDGIEFSTGNWNYGTRGAYGIGTVAAHHIVFSSGLGNA